MRGEVGAAGGERGAVGWGDDASGTAGKGSRLEVRARVRTLNMSSMVVTLEVSRVSGWLKALAHYRVARWAYEAGGGACWEVRGQCAERRKRHCREGLSAGEVGARARTLNMRSMVLTLDVSRVRGWLKLSAPCRLARWAYVPGRGARREVRGQ